MPRRSGGRGDGKEVAGERTAQARKGQQEQRPGGRKGSQRWRLQWRLESGGSEKGMRLESEAGGTPVLGRREYVISSLVLTEVTGGRLHQYHFKHNEREEVACPRITGPGSDESWDSE